MIVCLTGFMGAGKSSVGERLAALIGCEWVDLDSYIEKKIGMDIPGIFDFQGENGFRAIEAEALRDVFVMHLLTHTDMVLSLGGGTLQIGALRDYILENSRCIFLKAYPETLRKRLQESKVRRPVLEGDTDFEKLLEERERTYSLAQVTIRTDELDIEQTARRAFEIIKREMLDDKRV